MCCPAPIRRSSLRRKRPLKLLATEAATAAVVAVPKPRKSAAPLHPMARQYELELAERRAAHGRSHPAVAETLNALGLVHHHMASDPESALRCHVEALRILRSNAPFVRSLAVDVAMTLSDVGDVQWKLGEYGEATRAYGEALEAFEEAGKGEGHPRVVSTRNRLSRLQRGSAM